MSDEKDTASLWGAALLKQLEPDLLVFEAASSESPAPQAGEPQSVVEAFHRWQEKEEQALRMRGVKIRTDKSGAVIGIAVRLRPVTAADPEALSPVRTVSYTTQKDPRVKHYFSGAITTFMYDGKGRLGRVEEPPSEPPEQGTEDGGS
jgi:hypothetical protein